MMEWILWFSSLWSPRASHLFFLSRIVYLLVTVDEMQMAEFHSCQVHKGALPSDFDAFAEFGSFFFSIHLPQKTLIT